MTARLDCCRPTVYAPGSWTFVHGRGCTSGPAERSLTKAEQDEFKARRLAEFVHPAGKAVRVPAPPEWALHDKFNPTGCDEAGCPRCDPDYDDSRWIDGRYLADVKVREGIL